MKPIIDHIQITVKNISIAEPFYDKFLPILGFDINKKVSAIIVNKPKLYPESGSNYYVLFFKDLEGIKYEIVCNEHEEG